MGEIHLGQAVSQRVTSQHLKLKNQLEQTRLGKRKAEEELDEIRQQNKDVMRHREGKLDTIKTQLTSAKKKIRALNEIVAAQNESYNNQAKAMSRNIQLEKENSKWKRKYELIIRRHTAKNKECELLKLDFAASEMSVAKYKTMVKKQQQSIRSSPAKNPEIKRLDEDNKRLAEQLEKAKQSKIENDKKAKGFIERLRRQIIKLKEEKDRESSTLKTELKRVTHAMATYKSRRTSSSASNRRTTSASALSASVRAAAPASETISPAVRTASELKTLRSASRRSSSSLSEKRAALMSPESPVARPMGTNTTPPRSSRLRSLRAESGGNTSDSSTLSQRSRSSRSNDAVLRHIERQRAAREKQR